MDEHILLQRAEILDRQALTIIFERYHTPIYRFIYHYIEHVEVSEDLAAQVFSRLLQHLRQGTGPKENLRAWLYEVARNLIIDESRRQKHRNHWELNENLVSDVPDPEHITERVLAVMKIKALLTKLTEKQYTVLMLRYFAELEFDEIANVMEMPVGAVRALHHRGLTTLRRLMSMEEVAHEA